MRVLPRLRPDARGHGGRRGPRVPGRVAARRGARRRRRASERVLRAGAGRPRRARSGAGSKGCARCPADRAGPDGWAATRPILTARRPPAPRGRSRARCARAADSGPSSHADARVSEARPLPPEALGGCWAASRASARSCRCCRRRSRCWPTRSCGKASPPETELRLAGGRRGRERRRRALGGVDLRAAERCVPLRSVSEVSWPDRASVCRPFARLPEPEAAASSSPASPARRRRTAREETGSGPSSCVVPRPQAALRETRKAGFGADVDAAGADGVDPQPFCWRSPRPRSRPAKRTATMRKGRKTTMRRRVQGLWKNVSPARPAVAPGMVVPRGAAHRRPTVASAKDAPVLVGAHFCLSARWPFARISGHTASISAVSAIFKS